MMSGAGSWCKKYAVKKNLSEADVWVERRLTDNLWHLGKLEQVAKV